MTTAADRLIVALDTDASRAGEIFCQLRDVGVTWFKIGPQMLLQHSGMILVENMIRETPPPSLFLDLKVYDTSDTVYDVARRAFDLGARFLTVHATPSMLEAAMRAKPAGAYVNVIAVGPLTDADLWHYEGPPFPHNVAFDGIVCPVGGTVASARATGLITVCPGIRVNSSFDNHYVENVATPAEAIRAGADYLVVGRPITLAADPVAAARAIIAEMGEAASEA